MRRVALNGSKHSSKPLSGKRKELLTSSDNSSEESELSDYISNATSSSEDKEVFGDPLFAVCLDLEQVKLWLFHYYAHRVQD